MEISGDSVVSDHQFFTQGQEFQVFKCQLLKVVTLRRKIVVKAALNFQINGKVRQTCSL